MAITVTDHDDGEARRKVLKAASGDGALTGQAIVAAPGAGKRVVVTGVLCTSVSTETTLTLDEGSTKVVDVNLPASSGPVGFAGFTLGLAENAALNVDTSAAADISVVVAYEVQKV